MHRLVFLLMFVATALAGDRDSRYTHYARGVNLTRWFQYGSRIPITAADRDLLKKAGFTWVRIPVAPQYLLYYWSSPDRVTRNLADLDRGIDLFLDAGMAVTLDLHADKEYLDHYLTRPGAPESLVQLWRELAVRYANRNPDLLSFEIMNEPDNRFTEKDWDTEQQQALAAIRESAPQHTVVLDAVGWSGLDALLQMKPYSDPDVIYALHYYSPATFTHQGADWTGKVGVAELRNVPWPPFLPEFEELTKQEMSGEARALLRNYQREDWDASRIDWDLQLAAAWAKKWGVRVIVNEFGDLKTFSPPESRARWLHDVRVSMDKHKLGWAVWDYAAGFDLTLLKGGAREIDPAVSAALGLEAWTLPDALRTGPVPAFSGIRTVQLGAQPDMAGYAEGILATDANVVITPMTYPSLPEHPVQVFANSGGGILTPVLFDGPAPVQRSVLSIVAGRFDRSGRVGFYLPDRGPADGSGTQSKLILPSGADRVKDATGNLPQEIVVTVSAAAGDVDGDGVDDLAVLRQHGLELLRNDGAGRFRVDSRGLPAWASDPQMENNRFVCAAFVGRRNSRVPDLLVFGRGGSPARVLLNDGSGDFHDGTLLPQPVVNAGPALGGCAAVADLNGDGLADVIVGYTDVLQVLMNNGDGTFRDETERRMPALAAANGAIRRVAVSRGSRGLVLVVTRVGDAPLVLFEREGLFLDTGWDGTGSPWVVAPGDFNGDGLVDLVFGQGGGAPLLARFGQ